jgi:hypothetical protein
MPAEHAPKVAALGMIPRGVWATASKTQRRALIVEAQNDALVAMAKHAASRRLVPVGEPTFIQAYVAKPMPPIMDLGPDDPQWAFLVVVGSANTMGVVE